MNEMENLFPRARRFELYTGHRSEKNLHLYQKLGYGPFRTERVNDGLPFVCLERLRT